MRVDDVAGAVLLIEEFLAQSPTYRALEYSHVKAFGHAKALLDDPNAFCWVDEADDGQLVGVLAGVVCELPFTKDLVAQDYAFYFDAEHRGHKAVTLLRQFIRWAKAKGAKLVLMGITAQLDNDKATRLYQHIGFSHIGNAMAMEV
jgi:GNAT superfamily N-acetyltransferase